MFQESQGSEKFPPFKRPLIHLSPGSQGLISSRLKAQGFHMFARHPAIHPIIKGGAFVYAPPPLRREPRMGID